MLVVASEFGLVFALCLFDQRKVDIEVVLLLLFLELAFLASFRINLVDGRVIVRTRITNVIYLVLFVKVAVVGRLLMLCAPGKTLGP